MFMLWNALIDGVLDKNLVLNTLQEAGITNPITVKPSIAERALHFRGVSVSRIQLSALKVREKKKLLVPVNTLGDISNWVLAQLRTSDDVDRPIVVKSHIDYDEDRAFVW